MKSPTAFPIEAAWTPSEKKIARKAFDAAFLRQCSSITQRAKRMLESPTAPFDIWKLHDYLSRERKKVDLRYDYRYSVLLSVFAQLLRDKWLHEEDLNGLSTDKIEKIRDWADRLKS